MNCTIYVRVSTEKQRDGQGLEVQERAGVEFFANKKEFKGRKVVVYREVVSGRKESIEDRPVLAIMLKDLKFEDAIWFYDEDRMARDNLVKKAIIKALMKKNIKLFIRTVEYDLHNIQHILQLGIKGEIDEYFGAWLVQRMVAGKVLAFKKGKFRGGILNFGYAVKKDPTNKEENNKFVIDPEEKKIYDMMVDWYLQGEGSKKIAHRLNDKGIKPRCIKLFKKKKIKQRNKNTEVETKNLKWTSGTVLKILRNPACKGELTYGSHKAKVPALISPQRWALVQEQRRKNYDNAKRNTKRFSLLRGLLYCKKCQDRGKPHRLFALYKPRKRMKIYVCRSKALDPKPDPCGLKNVNMDKLDSFVWDTIRELAKNSSKLKEAIRAQKDSLFVDDALLEIEFKWIEDALGIKEKAIKTLIKEYAELGKVSKEELDEAISELRSERDNLLIDRRKITDRITRAETAQRNAKKIEDYMAEIGKRIDNLNEQERYEFIHAIVNKMMIDYDGKDHIIEIVLAVPIIEDRKKLPASITRPQLQHALGYAGR